MYGGNVATRLSSGGFDNPSSDSSQAQRLLDDRFHTGSPNLVLLVDAGRVDGRRAPVAAAGRALTARLAAEPGVADVASYWSLGDAAPLRSRDAHQALVVARITGTDKQVSERIKQLQPVYARSFEGLSVRVGGDGRGVPPGRHHHRARPPGGGDDRPAHHACSCCCSSSAGLVAAVLPLVIGAISIVGTFTVLKVMTELTNVSVFALNLTTALGLGLAIDYSLFVVSRFREERAAGFDSDTAVQRTVRAAGRTVAFSAFTVAVSLSVLLVFPTAFLRSFAYAGVAVGIIAGSGLGRGAARRCSAAWATRSTRWPCAARARSPPSEGVWHRIATVRDALADPGRDGRDRPAGRAGQPVRPHHPRASPTTGCCPRRPRAARSATSCAPSSTAARRTPSRSWPPPRPRPAPAPPRRRPSTATRRGCRGSRGVARVDARTGIYADGTKVAGPGTGHPALRRHRRDLALGRALGRPGVRRRRAARPRPACRPGPVRRSRSAAAPPQRVDTNTAIYSRLPLALAIIATTTFILLFLMFGSVVVPAKALVLNVLSLTATFGAMVWIFQEGHLSGLLGFTPTGTIDAGTPILMFCIAFGLSMDYEVFLLVADQGGARRRPQQRRRPWPSGSSAPVAS